MSRIPNRPGVVRSSRWPAAAAAVALAGALLGLAPAARAVDGKPSANVDWQEAASDADIEHAFAAARAQRKPVLLYWGAVWCPPCNQLKATLFNRQDFAERSKSFVAVHLDGDAPGAQKLGTRFKVVGYPTMILFSPEGKELTRLPGEADAPQVMQVLQLGLASGRPVAEVLADARAGKALPGSEWRLLAFYSWDTDESALVPAAERGAVLRKLAAGCPAAEAEACTRLMLKSLVDDEEKSPRTADAATRERVAKLLADPPRSRALMDVLTNFAPELVTALAPASGAERQRLVAALDAALVRLQSDTTLSRADRMTALYARIDLARIDQKDQVHPKLPAALVKEARECAAQADKEITNSFERQAVIPEASQVLANVGLFAESDALLKASLDKSHSPYYLMSELGANARKEGRTAEALHWYQQAFDKSEGPATRLQWGQSYLNALVDLAPQDAKRIEDVARTLIGEAAAQPNAFYERSARSLERMGKKLVGWNAGGRHQAAIDRLQAQLQGVCGKLPAGEPQRATCEGLLKPEPRKA
jgi:thioredoxin-related protein